MAMMDQSPDKLARKAARAAERGDTRFALRVVDRLGATTNENAEWAESIAAVEASGWLVDHFSSTVDRRDNMVANVLFCRAR